MTDAMLQAHVQHLLRELLEPRNKQRLEAYRFRGSTNRVYKIPLSAGSSDFIIVKLVPSMLTLWKKRAKRALRNVVYGEHYVALGARRVQQELDNTREWQRAGMPVPAAVDTGLPGVRVFRGLPYPTLFTVFSDSTISDDRKLDILNVVVRSLRQQHQTARDLGKQGLVHGDPGPWNIMFGLDVQKVYWFDLEHPAHYPRMTLDDLIIRALRIFLFGVLDHLGHRLDDVMAVFAAAYGNEAVLSRLAKEIAAPRGSFLLRAVEAAGLKKRSSDRRKRIAAALAACLAETTNRNAGRSPATTWR
jgi:tRNA A-37 threonylcarbamoyl transferase component Bud32